jgi:hypothetical protein
MLSVARRNHALLPIEERPAFIALLHAAFRSGGPPIRRSLRSELASGAWKRLARDRGIPLDARPAELDVFDWVAVFRLTRSAPAAAGHPNR